MIHDSVNCIWFRPQERVAIFKTVFGGDVNTQLPERDLLLNDQNSEQNSNDSKSWRYNLLSKTTQPLWKKNGVVSHPPFFLQTSRLVFLSKKTKTQSSARRHQQPHQFPTRRPWRQWGRKPRFKNHVLPTTHTLKMVNKPLLRPYS